MSHDTPSKQERALALLRYVNEAFMATPQFATGDRFEAYKELKTLLTQSESGEAFRPREVLMDQSLFKYTIETMYEACSAWSDVKGPDGMIDEAKCEYANAVENKLAAAIKELADLSLTPSAIELTGETPRTNAAAVYGGYVKKAAPMVPKNVCAQIERELNEARALLRPPVA